MSTSPQSEFRSEQFEFTTEQNRTVTELAHAMGVVATLLKLIGAAFLVFFVLLAIPAYQTQTGYGPVIGLGAAMIFCLSLGFWTSSSANSFRKIVESKNQDIWHLMNALGRLRDLYSLLRTIILGSLVLLIIGLALGAYEYFKR